MFLILLILSIFLSCQDKKISDTKVSDPIEQDYAVVEEVEEISITDNNLYGIVDTVQTNEIMPVEAIDMKEDYDNAFSVWMRASKKPFSNASIDHIVYGNGRFVATGSHENSLAYSDDGDIWHIVENNIFGNSSIDGVAYGNGRFVAVSSGDKIAYSDDGETWTLSKNGIGDYDTSDIAYGNNRFVIVGYHRNQYTGISAYSMDGETWIVAEDGSLGIDWFNCIAYGNRKFIVGAYGGGVVYSNDGETWTVMQ